MGNEVFSAGSDDWYKYNDPGGLFPGNPAKKQTPPPPPDYIGFAKEQGAQNIALAKQNAILNNPNVTNALGSQTVTFDENGRPHVTQNLNPQLQSVLSGMHSSAAGLVPELGEAMSRPFNYSGVEDLQNKAQEAILSRLEPQFARDEQAMLTRLANQGIARGTEAFEQDTERFDRAKNDARLQAVLSGMQMAPQLLQEETFLRQQPIGDIRALISGSPSLPQFGGFNPSGNARAGDFQSAAQAMGQADRDIFNFGQAQNAQQRQMLASAGLTAAGLMFSDRRLKSNVVRVGTHPLGIGVYEYDIFGARQRGVMADEVERVLPQAVTEVLGFKAVDYSMLGG